MADKSRGFAVADQCVVLDARGHICFNVDEAGAADDEAIVRD